MKGEFFEKNAKIYGENFFVCAQMLNFRDFQGWVKFV